MKGEAETVSPETSSNAFKSLVPSNSFDYERRAEMRQSVENYIKRYPREYTPGLIENMKRLKMARPTWIPTKDWNQAGKQLTPQENVICYMAAWGIDPNEISKQVGYSVPHIHRLIESDAGVAKMEEIQFKIFGADPKKWIEAILPKAIRTAQRLMEDPVVKPATRLDAAKYFMDRQLGKPLQKIENNDSTLRQLFDRMDAEKNKPVIDVTNIPMAQEVAQQPQGDEIDQWVNQNL